MAIATNKTPKLIPASITIEKTLLLNVDRRAKRLDLSRSQYFRRLVRADLAQAERKVA